MKEFVISENLANEILRYLGNRPYAEVVQLVQGLLAVRPVEAPPATPANA